MKKILELINDNGILSSLIASIIFAIGIYIFNTDKRVLTFKEVTHEKLFDKEENFGLTIFTNDSIELKRNIFFIEVDIWNQGNHPIEKKDIKDIFGFRLQEGYQFIPNVKLIETHKEVTKSEIKFDSIGSEILIEFEFLEKRNGLKIKSYYTSNEKEKSTLKPIGYVAQNTEIKHYNSTFTERYRIWTTLFFAATGFIIIWYLGRYVSDYIDSFLDKSFSGYIKNSVLRRIIGFVVYIAIAYFLIIKFVSKVPKWIYDFLTEYFNRDSPF